MTSPSKKVTRYTPPLPKPKVKKPGHRGRVKVAFRKRCRDKYGKLHGEPVEGGFSCICQICGRFAYSWHLDSCHKETSGNGGPISRDVETNILAAHGHRMGPKNCHDWADETEERRKIMKASAVNVITGGKIVWPQHLKESLELVVIQMRN